MKKWITVLLGAALLVSPLLPVSSAHAVENGIDFTVQDKVTVPDSHREYTFYLNMYAESLTDMKFAVPEFKLELWNAKSNKQISVLKSSEVKYNKYRNILQFSFPVKSGYKRGDKFAIILRGDDKDPIIKSLVLNVTEQDTTGKAAKWVFKNYTISGDSYAPVTALSMECEGKNGPIASLQGSKMQPLTGGVIFDNQNVYFKVADSQGKALSGIELTVQAQGKETGTWRVRTDEKGFARLPFEKVPYSFELSVKGKTVLGDSTFNKHILGSDINELDPASYYPIKVK